jgi:phage tail sheath gpL-like
MAGLDDGTALCRVNVLYPPDYVNGLRIFALLNQFRQQYAADAA